jgi:aminoglycoside phosphotransferase (APT) family kinase protein
MEPIAGFCATQDLPDPVRADPSIQANMGFAMVDAALALGAVDHVAVGLADFGKTENYLERQVSRWRTQLESYRLHDRWDGEADMAGVDEVGKWLDTHRPASFTPGIVHGDYHLANVMFAPDGRRLAAIIDWELSSLGDPLLDLGWMLATWPNPDGSDSGSGLAAPGCDALPAPQALLERYAAGTPRDLSHFEWYRVLACYKLAILQEGSYARASVGKADPQMGREQHARAIAMIARARTFIDVARAPFAEMDV